MIVASLKQGNSKLTAILLLAIAAILVYLLCFHWFILSHLSYGGEISELQEQLDRYRQPRLSQQWVVAMLTA